MKKNEVPHSLEVSIGLADKTLSGKCSCVAGISRYCHHVIRCRNKYATALEHPKGKNFTVIRDPGGVGKETANGCRLQQTLFDTFF